MLATPKRNAGIDGLRGLSIVLVVMHHLGIRIPLKHSVLADMLPQWCLNALIYNGYAAVVVFFVISGFLITTNALDRWGDLSRVTLTSFYARRATRILPCLLILVAVLSLLHLTAVDHYVIYRKEQSLPRAILAALALHLNWYEGVTGYLPASWDVLWSLSIEEVFYLGFPLACLAFSRSRLLVPLLLILALSLPFTRSALAGNEVWREKAYLPGMSSIAVGVLAALFAAKYRLSSRAALSWLSAAFGGGLIAILCAEGPVWRLIGDTSILLLSITAAGLITVLHWQGQNAPLWGTRWTAWLRSCGRLSYEIYLSHVFIMWLVVDSFKAMGENLRWGILWYGPALLGSWMLGWLIARFYSVPLERVLRRRLVPASTRPL